MVDQLQVMRHDFVGQNKRQQQHQQQLLAELEANLIRLRAATAAAAAASSSASTASSVHGYQRYRPPAMPRPPGMAAVYRDHTAALHTGADPMMINDCPRETGTQGDLAPQYSKLPASNDYQRKDATLPASSDYPPGKAPTLAQAEALDRELYAFLKQSTLAD